MTLLAPNSYGGKEHPIMKLTELRYVTVSWRLDYVRHFKVIEPS
jgi:hypothetical protein